MSPNIRVVPSGFSLIDKKWGGVYRGGSYLLVGPRKSGRTLLGIQLAKQCAKNNEVCIYFTNMRPKDLMIHAASIGFDIQKAMNRNLVIVVRVAAPTEAYETYNPDEYLIEYLNDILTVVKEYNPHRIVFDELTHYVGFNNLHLMRDVFLNNLEIIEDRDITSFFVMGEAATGKAKEITDTITECVTGIIQIKKSNNMVLGKYHGGTITIIPNVGHTEGRASEEYFIKPYKGVRVVSEEEDENSEKLTENESSLRATRNTYTIPVTKQTTDNDVLGFSNLYEYNDFSLVLNNQIALFKSTGQIFTLMSFKLDPAMQVKGLLSFNQLQNAVRLSTDRKDKICIVDNLILILVVKSKQNSVSDIVYKLLNNLPSLDESYVNTIKSNLDVSNMEVKEHIANADNMMQSLMSVPSVSLEKFSQIGN